MTTVYFLQEVRQTPGVHVETNQVFLNEKPEHDILLILTKWICCDDRKIGNFSVPITFVGFRL